MRRGALHGAPWRWLLHLLALLFGLLLPACAPEPGPQPTATPRQVALSGQLLPLNDEASAAGLRVALCRVTREVETGLPDCDLHPEAATVGQAGRFEFESVDAGDYLLLYESGLADFDAALAALGGATLYLSNWNWLHSEVIQAAPGQHLNLRPSAAIRDDPSVDLLSFSRATLLIDGSPFVAAHEIDRSGASPQVRPVLITLASPQNDLALVLYRPALPDYAAAREAIGPLTQAEQSQLDRDLALRWATFMAGDDSAYHDTDQRVIAALRSGTVIPIVRTSITAVEEHGAELVKSWGYLVRDRMTGQPRLVGSYDPASGEVIEIDTGYRLRVLDPGPERLVVGPNGEQFYAYGFGWDPRWERLLPQPVIDLLDAFYTRGALYVGRNYGVYASEAASYGGDLQLIEWDADTQALIQAWRPDPAYAPWIYLPDSGTIDVSRDRFLRAMIDGQVSVRADPLDDFMRSRTLRSSSYLPDADRQQVIDSLLVAYRSGHLFTDMEAAIILAATYGEQPLEVVITQRVQSGLYVPRRADGVYISEEELANVVLGYPGALNSRWPHEMGHVLDFRAPQYEFRAAGGMVCEPVKYIMEFMWWVDRYPGDAPDWDWLPINSGLALARLLAGEYHNSGC